MHLPSLRLLATSSLLVASVLAGPAVAEGKRAPARARPAPAARPNAASPRTAERAAVPARTPDATKNEGRPAVRTPAEVQGVVDAAAREARIARDLHERRETRELERADADEALLLIGAEEIAAARLVYDRARAEALPIVARFGRDSMQGETPASIADRKQMELELLRPILQRAHNELDVIAQRVLAKLSLEQELFLTRRLAAKGIHVDEGRKIARIAYLLTLVETGPFQSALKSRDAAAPFAGEPEPPTRTAVPAAAQRRVASARPAGRAAAR